MTAKSKAADDAVTTSEPAGFPLTLDEFCARLSARLRKPELISGFHSAQTLSGATKSTEEAFQARFDEFVNKPV